jgi:hypothetical protein
MHNILLVIIYYLEFGKLCTSICNENKQLIIPSDIQHFRIGTWRTLIATKIVCSKSSETITSITYLAVMHVEFYHKIEKRLGGHTCKATTVDRRPLH